MSNKTSTQYNKEQSISKVNLDLINGFKLFIQAMCVSCGVLVNCIQV